MILYALRRTGTGYMLAKFDKDFNVEATYTLTPLSNANGFACDCPAARRAVCRHRNMLPRMLPKVDTAEFYCYETNTWHRPIEAYGDADEAGSREAAAVGEALGELAKSPPPIPRVDPLPAQPGQVASHEPIVTSHPPTPAPEPPKLRRL